MLMTTLLFSMIRIASFNQKFFEIRKLFNKIGDSVKKALFLKYLDEHLKYMWDARGLSSGAILVFIVELTYIVLEVQKETF